MVASPPEQPHLRLAIDTGGTFTDLVVDDPRHGISLHKAFTTPDDPVRGILDVLALAAEQRGESVAALLGAAGTLAHATTRALNAVLTRTTARTALVVTEGHEDVLVLREGGRADAFDFSYDYPPPYVPRALTFGLRERIGASGEVVVALRKDEVVELAGRLRAASVESVAVCLLWSVADARHERLVGDVLARELPGVPVTLSHELSPAIREYRRASATAIDASLRPLMDGHLGSLERRLRDAGFGGRLLMASSTGGLLEIADVAAAPIHALNSGPSLAPIAGRREAGEDADVIVADAGGTSFDVSVVRGGEIPRTRETWLGPRFRGWMTGFPSVDVRSIGAGGGSIASVDAAGLLHVGPQSAGADPGPVAYGHGGERATVTDAAVALGYLDAAGFLGGTASLDADGARRAIAEQVGGPLGLATDEAAAAVLDLASEQMVGAIEDVTVGQGVDPADAVLVGGGGAIGLNLATIVRRLSCRRAILPSASAALSASGALEADVVRDVAAVAFASTADFDHAAIDALLAELERQARAFLTRAGGGEGEIRLFAEARYPRQVWELEVAVPTLRLSSDAELTALRDVFHERHRATFAFSEPHSPIEVTAWRMRATCAAPTTERAPSATGWHAVAHEREAWVRGAGRMRVPVRGLGDLREDEPVAGPAIVEAGLTTLVLGPGDEARRLASGALEVTCR